MSELSSNDLGQQLQLLVREVLGDLNTPIDLHTDLEGECNLDSLTRLRIVIAINDHFDIDFGGEKSHLDALRCISTLADAVASVLESSARRP